MSISPRWKKLQVALSEALRADGFSTLSLIDNIFVAGHARLYTIGTIRVSLGEEGAAQPSGWKVYSLFTDSDLDSVVSDAFQGIRESAVNLKGEWSGYGPPHLSEATFSYSASLPTDANVNDVADLVRHVADESHRAGMLMWRKYHRAKQAA